MGHIVPVEHFPGVFVTSSLGADLKRSPFLITNDVLIDLEARAHDDAVSELISTYRVARERVALLEDMLVDEIQYFVIAT